MIWRKLERVKKNKWKWHVERQRKRHIHFLKQWFQISQIERKTELQTFFFLNLSHDWIFTQERNVITMVGKTLVHGLSMPCILYFAKLLTANFRRSRHISRRRLIQTTFWPKASLYLKITRSVTTRPHKNTKEKVAFSFVFYSIPQVMQHCCIKESERNIVTTENVTYFVSMVTEHLLPSSLTLEVSMSC